MPTTPTDDLTEQLRGAFTASVADVEVPADLATRVRRGRTTARRRTLAFRVAVPAAVGALAVAALAVGNLTSSPEPQQIGAAPGQNATPTGALDIRLAGLHFTAPAGYVASGKPCPAPAHWKPAASALPSGGCLDVRFTGPESKNIKEGDAKDLRGIVTRTGPTSLELRVINFSGDDLLGVEYTASGIDLQDLVAVSQDGR